MLSEKLLSEWNFKRNTIPPEKVAPKSGLKVWWLGACGHEWEAVVHSRTAGRGCPFCAGKQVLPGFNDVASRYPDLVVSWSSRNGSTPEEYSFSSGKKVWWECEKGHEWEASIDNRVKGRGCPFCSGRTVLVGFNDLAFINPGLAMEWSSKNVLLPEQVTAKSNVKVWWECEKGHEWEARVANRSNGQGCPVCSGNMVNQGHNDLLSLYPGLADEWHADKNKKQPNQVSAFTSQKFWWKCDEGHEWETSIINRTKFSTGCSFCSGRVPIANKTDLKTTHPGLVEQFSLTRNSPELLSLLSHGSDVKVWWECEKGHEWEAVVYSRTSKTPTGCPECAYAQSSSSGEKELQSFLKEISLFPILFNNRSALFPLELDVYIPDKNIAVEFNGVYWHDENHKPKMYHYDKWKACQDKGIQLIQIWEDDWNRNPELIKRMLSHKLGVSQERKMYARKTRVQNISRAEANKFLNTYHIQGAVDGGVRLGLVSGEDLVAVMVLKKEPGVEGTLNLLRFATSCIVVGGFTKILNYVREVLKPSSVVTFSDNTVSDGGLYENNGFVAVKNIKPDYMYVVNKQREHKFGYRLKRFENDPNLIFEVKLSEKQLALLNNIPRIWDAGKIKWEISFDDNLIGKEITI